MKKNITPAEIFAAKQVLTLDVVPQLIGKTIAITNAESSYNTPDVRIFKVLGIESQFEAALRNPVKDFESQQHMWIAEGNESTIEWAKNRTVLKYQGDIPFATVEKNNFCLPAGTFFGSDADREIFYIILD